MPEPRPNEVYKDSNDHIWQIREDGVTVDCLDQAHFMPRTFEQLVNVHGPVVRVLDAPQGLVKDIVEPLAEWEKELLKGSDTVTFPILRAADSQPVNDPVNHPAHYTAYPVEVIELTEWLTYNRGCAVKYLSRAGLKDPDTEVQDLEKAAWYVAREIERIRKLKEAA